MNSAKINTRNTVELMQRFSVIAKDLVGYHLPGFTINWRTTCYATGQCWYGQRRIIDINIYHAVKYGEDEFIETVLHEIAHGIVKEGHTQRWKDVYIAIGGNGTVTLQESIAVAQLQKQRAAKE